MMSTLKNNNLKVQISCHKNNLKSVHADYIYHRNEKGKPCGMELPFRENDITRIFWT